MDGIIVDTSSILFAMSNNVDLFARIEEQLGKGAVVSKGVIRELKGIASSNKKSAGAAKAALDIIDRGGVRVADNSDYVDDWIMASKKSDIVCTNDTKLRDALRAKKVKVYTVSRSGELR